MSLPVTEVERELLHTRRVRYEGYKRADGLWDIEAHLTDIKNHDYHLKTGVRRAGQPVHSMWLRLTIDRRLNVVDAAGKSHQLVLAGLDDEHAQIDLGGAQREIGIGDLSSSWFGDYVLLWRPAQGDSVPLALGARNARVKWLRDSLRRVNGLPAEQPADDRYDASVVTLVEDFQRRNRLAVDGIAGVQTQVALDAALNDATTPFLRNTAGS